MKSPDLPSTGMTDAESVKIISAYGNAILSNGSAYGDSHALPYPKARIKEALIIGIRKTSDPRLREQLKGAYVALAGWQAGASGAEFTAEELQDPKGAIARVLEPDFVGAPESVSAEAKALLAELVALGL